MQGVIPQAPREIFKHQETPAQGIVRENLVTYLIDHFEFGERGIEVFYKDIPYARKGYPSPESVSAVNIVKRLFIESIKVFSTPELLIGGLACLISPRRTKIVGKIISAFNRLAYGIVSPYMLKPELMTPCSSELQGIIYAFLIRIGIDKDQARHFAEIFGTLIQYDNAYLYRIEDLCSETTKEKLMMNPRKEIKRLTALFLEREKRKGQVDLKIIADPLAHSHMDNPNYYSVSRKFKIVSRLISFALIFPKTRKSFIKAIENSEFERLQYDEADRYWVRGRTDYDFFGEPLHVRMEGYTRPQAVTIEL